MPTALRSYTNKAFEEYFGEIKETLIEEVAPQDKERLMDFIEKYDGTAKSGMFKFIKKHAIIQHIVGFYLVTLLLNVRRSFNGTRKVQQS